MTNIFELQATLICDKYIYLPPPEKKNIDQYMLKGSPTFANFNHFCFAVSNFPDNCNNWFYHWLQLTI